MRIYIPAIVLLFFASLANPVLAAKPNYPSPTPTPEEEISPTPTLVITTPTPTPTPIFLSPTLPLKPAFVPTLFVAPEGSDNNDGKSIQSPLQTIQKAVDLANPGDVIKLLPGAYLQDVVTKRDGLPNQPIVITGSRQAVVQGEKNARIFEINKSVT